MKVTRCIKENLANMARKSRNKRLLLAIGAGTTLVLAASFIVSYFSTGSTAQTAGSNKEQTKCVIITESIYNANMNWKEILEKDIVLILPPGCKYGPDLKQYNPDKSFKIISCTTQSGLWAVVRHTKKEQLLLVPEDFDDKMPTDIPRYVKSIVRLERNAISI